MKKAKKHWLLLIGIACVVIIVAGIIATYFAYGVRKQVRSGLEAGEKYLSELDYEQAIVTYQQVLEVDPNNREAKLGLAEAYDSGQEFVYAENVYRTMLDNGDTAADVYYKLADLYIREGKLDEARELLDEAANHTNDEDISRLHEMTKPQAPQLSYESGTYQNRIAVEIVPSGEQETIYYTLDGSAPDLESSVYQEPLILRNGKTNVKAIAVNILGYQSEEAAAEYDLQIPDIEITLEDSVIEKIVRDKLQIGYNDPIYNDDIAQITELYIVSYSLAESEDEYSVRLRKEEYIINDSRYQVSGPGIVYTLNDLCYMPFLSRVAVDYQPELDISALSSCTSIEELSLVGDNLNRTDITALGGLINLRKLNLGWNAIHDISPLSSLTGLTSLGIWGNQIRDLSPVAVLTNLEYLDFADNQVTDITSVSGLTNLKQLWMYHNGIKDISPVSGLSKLQVLMLYDNPIENPEVVRSIYPHLTRLDVDLLKLGGRE